MASLYNMPQSYKIFIKDVPLLITDAQENIRTGEYELTNRDILAEFIPLVEKKYRSAGKGMLLLSEDPAADFDLVRRQLDYIAAAGGIVWNRNGELLMIFRRGKWDLPKGKVEENESIETAALREVEEESGVGKLRIIQKFGSSFHIYQERKQWILKETHWFEMLSQDEGITMPQASEGITEAHWVARHDIAPRLKNTYASMLELVNDVMRRGYDAPENNS